MSLRIITLASREREGSFHHDHHHDYLQIRIKDDMDDDDHTQKLISFCLKLTVNVFVWQDVEPYGVLDIMKIFCGGTEM